MSSLITEEERIYRLAEFCITPFADAINRQIQNHGVAAAAILKELDSLAKEKKLNLEQVKRVRDDLQRLYNDEMSAFQAPIRAYQERNYLIYAQDKFKELTTSGKDLFPAKEMESQENYKELIKQGLKPEAIKERVRQAMTKRPQYFSDQLLKKLSGVRGVDERGGYIQGKNLFKPLIEQADKNKLHHLKLIETLENKIAKQQLAAVDPALGTAFTQMLEFEKIMKSIMEDPKKKSKSPYNTLTVQHVDSASGIIQKMKKVADRIGEAQSKQARDRHLKVFGKEMDAAYKLIEDAHQKVRGTKEGFTFAGILKTLKELPNKIKNIDIKNIFTKKTSSSDTLEPKTVLNQFENIKSKIDEARKSASLETKTPEASKPTTKKGV